MRIIVFTLLLLVFNGSTVLANDAVKLVVSEWETYSPIYYKKGKMLEEIVIAAFSQENIKVQIHYLPRKRGIAYAKDGTFDGIFPWGRGDAQPKGFYSPGKALFIEEDVYFHLNGMAFEWDDMEDLKQYKLGVIIGHEDESYYKEQGLIYEAVATDELNFNRLLANRIDAYQSSKITGYTTIKNMFSAKKSGLFSHHPRVIERHKSYVLFSKKSSKGKSFSKKLDSGLSKLMKTGEYQEIINSYIGDVKF